MYSKPIRASAGAAVAALLSAVLALAGCASTPAALRTQATLSPADLGLPVNECAPTGFVILADGPSSGRFPAALAIAKLRQDVCGTSQYWRTATLKEEHAVWWNSLFDSVPVIREVIVMSEHTVGPAGTVVPTPTAAAARLNAGLCLVYGPAPAGADEAALIGALIDTREKKPIACIRSHITPADFKPPRPDRYHNDKRHVDAEYLAAQQFEQQVRLCIIDLISRDKPAGMIGGAVAPQSAPAAE